MHRAGSAASTCRSTEGSRRPTSEPLPRSMRPSEAPQFHHHERETTMQHRRTWVAVAAALALLPAAHATDIPTSDPDLKVRLDLTPKYSMGYRLKNPSAALTQLDVAADP